MKHLILIVTIALLPLCVSAQSYSASHLEKAVQKLQLDPLALAADSLPMVKTINHSGKDIVLRFSAQGAIEHIGIPLFSREMRLLQPSPVYDFLEYATLNYFFKVDDNTLRLDEVKFSKGGWNLLPGILAGSDYCSISNLDDKHYQVEWFKDAQKVAELRFPINYELLANSEREEMERRLTKGLVAYHETSSRTPMIDSKRLQRTEDPNMLVMQGQTYIIPAINNHRYVTVVSEVDTTVVDTVEHHVLKYSLLFDRHNADESLANLMVEPAMDVDNDSISVQVRYYNYKRETLKVAMKDFLGYFQKEGCTPYFGIDETEGSVITGTLFLVNKASGYVHLVNVTCDTDNLFGEHPLLKATMFMFTPLSNVKNLFGKLDPNNDIHRKYVKQYIK